MGRSAGGDCIDQNRTYPDRSRAVSLSGIAAGALQAAAPRGLYRRTAAQNRNRQDPQAAVAREALGRQREARARVEYAEEPQPAIKIWSLGEMEKTGGEPDVVGHDQKTPETPKKRLLRPGRPGKEGKKGLTSSVNRGK